MAFAPTLSRTGSRSFVLALLGGLVACSAVPNEGGVASNQLDPVSGGSESPLESSCWPGSATGCVPGSGESCDVGLRYCDDDGSWGACIPSEASAELCGDGVDNDCNGFVDDKCGITGSGGGGGSGGEGGTGGCKPGAPVACETVCGTPGDATCRGDGTPGDCIPPKELCGNGRDDDCDGKVDEDCGETTDCRKLQPHECNGDLGYGDHCAPEDNVKGCDWEWFQAWCHRRDEANGGGQKWDDTIKKWVEDRCDGTVTFSGNTYQCTDSNGHTWKCDTPLVLVFESGPVPLLTTPGQFDLSGTQASFGSDWPTAKTPWLALDRDENGRIDDGSELFGSATRLADGRRAANGFEALAELDADGDGAITPRDPGYARLVLWADANGNRRSEPGELEPLAARGVTSLGLGYRSERRCDARGNCEVERATFEAQHDGTCQQGSIVDLHLRRR